VGERVSALRVEPLFALGLFIVNFVWLSGLCEANARRYNKNDSNGPVLHGVPQTCKEECLDFSNITDG
jgi:hypothetical protein